jgi:small subunit ribosomal protein S16
LQGYIKEESINMIRIRLSRQGSKNHPFYHIVALEKRSKRDGKFLEVLGYWHPSKNTKKINKEKIKEWVDKGASVTETVAKLIKE